MKRAGALLMDLKVGQSLTIDGGRIIMTLEDKSGQRIKVRFVLDEDVLIERPGAQFRGSSTTGAKQALLGIKAG